MEFALKWLNMASDGRMEEQKKRTLDALQRRFAQAEAEVQIQEQKTKKIPREDHDRINHHVKDSLTDASVASSSGKPSKRGIFFFMFAKPTIKNLKFCLAAVLS